MSSLEGEVYAASEMLGHVALSRELSSPFGDLPLRIAGLSDCESLFAHLRDRKAIADKYSARHFSRIRQAF